MLKFLQASSRISRSQACFQKTFMLSLFSQKRHFRVNGILLEEKTFEVPPFAESISEGDIVWSKAVGDYVHIDELIGEIETDKTTVPVPAQVAGKLTSFLVDDGSKVSPGMKIYKIDTDAAPSAVSEKKEPVKAQSPPPSNVQVDQKVAPKSPPPSPQPNKEIEAFKPSVGSSRTEQRVKMNRMRLKIAQRLKDSQNTCAMLTTFNEVDMTNLIEMRKKYMDVFMKKHGVKLGFMSAFTKAAAYALNDQPVINAVIDGDSIVYRDYVDINIAVATPKGLVVPVLRDVHHMNYMDIEKEINRLGDKAKSGQLSVEDMESGTFTISNGGVFGSLFGTPIINPPQSAILGMHATFDRPVVRNGEIVIRPMMYLALTYDHRLIDGREAVTFLKKIKEFVEDPRIYFMNL